MFTLLLFVNHNFSGPGSSSRDIPIAVQLVVEPLMKTVVISLIGSRALKLKRLIDWKPRKFSSDCLKPVSFLSLHYPNNSYLVT